MDASVYVAGRRAEFRLPSDAVLKPNFRLLNVGLVGATADEYNPLTGAYGIIESIQLFDGSQPLDQDLEFSRYAGLKNALHSNAETTSNVNKLAKSELGYAAVGPTIFDETGAISRHPLISTGENLTVQNNIIPATADSELVKEQRSAWLDVRSCLGFLRQSSVVPTTLYTNLRLVINYKSQAQLKLDGIVSDSTKAFTYARPFLCYETLEGDAAAQFSRDYKGVSFNAVETAIVHVPTVAGGATQQRSFNITGFDDKYVDKMLLIQEPLDAATYRDGNLNVGYGNQGSVSQNKQKLQLSINGRNIFPQSIEGKMNRLAMTTEAWGKLNISAGQNFIGVQASGEMMSDEMTKRIGELDYTGFFVRNVVRDLKLTYDREGVAAEARLLQALNLRLVGVVRRAVIVADGSYRVLYV
jgi:hypothetical protein